MIILIVGCPIKGQVRGECALHPSCQQTCNNNETLICLTVCVVHGCQCPNGTVIDEDKNECVAPSECTGMYVHHCTYVCMAFSIAF